MFTTSGAFPDLDAEYRGRDAMRRYWETIRGAFEYLHMDAVHVVERDDDILSCFAFARRAARDSSSTAASAKSDGCAKGA